MKHQLHPSGMESLARCGIAYERRYINGEKTPHSARAAIGTAVDKSVRENLKAKITDRVLLDEMQVREIARDTLVAEWAKGVRITEEDREDAATGRDKAIDMSVDLAGLHYDKLAPAIQPTHVARKWVLDIDGLNLQVAGEIDIQEGTAAIRDTKTSGKSPVKTLADESLQLSAYALAVRQLDGTLPDKVVLDYLVQTPKRGDLKLVQLESVRRAEHLQPVLERLAHMDKILTSGIFTPAPIGSWWCSARYCPYHDTCRFAARPVSVHVTSSPVASTNVQVSSNAADTILDPSARSGRITGDNSGSDSLSGPDDLCDKLQQSIEIANGQRAIHLVHKWA